MWPMEDAVLTFPPYANIPLLNCFLALCMELMPAQMTKIFGLKESEVSHDWPASKIWQCSVVDVFSELWTLEWLHWLRKWGLGNSLVVQWLGLRAFIAKGLGLTPGQGTKIPVGKKKEGKRERKKERKGGLGAESIGQFTHTHTHTHTPSIYSSSLVSAWLKRPIKPPLCHKTWKRWFEAEKCQGLSPCCEQI